MTGQQLKEWMRTHEYTGVAFADELGVNRRTVFRWLSEETVPPPWIDLVVQGLECKRSHRK